MKNLSDKYIFTPGPVKMSDEIKEIGGAQVPYFRNKEFSKILLECEGDLLELLNAPLGSRVVFLTSSGTGAMEASVMNLLNKNDKIIAINGGSFGQRFVDICRLHDLETIELKVDDDNLSDISPLEKIENGTALLVNGHETSKGLLFDLQNIGDFCAKKGIFFVVDAISMFLTDELDMQKFSIDAVILSSQKALGLAPGLSMVVLSPRAIERSSLSEKVSMYFDFKRYLKDGERGQTPFTPAVGVILQLHRRLSQIKNFGGVQNQNAKAKEIAEYFRREIKDLPLKFATKHLPNAITALTPTDGKRADEIVKDLDEKYNVVVTPNGGEDGQKIFRVSHMGDMTKGYTDVLIGALKDYYGVKK